jgi:hypothetical protein
VLNAGYPAGLPPGGTHLAVISPRPVWLALPLAGRLGEWHRAWSPDPVVMHGAAAAAKSAPKAPGTGYFRFQRPEADTQIMRPCRGRI